MSHGLKIPTNTKLVLCFLVYCSVDHTVSRDSNMATRMRITVITSLVVVLLSSSRVISAQLPVPVTCFERCPVTDAECIDACQREVESGSEIEEQFPKRASAFVRIGRPALDKRASSFIRIGRKQSPVDVVDEVKRKDSFVRIGRPSAFVRIGKRQSGNDAKRASSFVRIGKSSEPAESPIEVDTTGNKRTSSSFVRIGRGDGAAAADQGWVPSRW